MTGLAGTASRALLSHWRRHPLQLFTLVAGLALAAAVLALLGLWALFSLADLPLREDLRGKAELIIGKQRNGPTGVVHLVFLHKYTRFENLAEDLGEPPPEG